MSIAGGTPKAIERAFAVGSTAVQIFLKNNNQWRGKEITPAEAEAFRAGIAAGSAVLLLWVIHESAGAR